MTSKASAFAVAVIAAMVFATAASAAPPLSLHAAEQIAKRLAQKEVRGRNIVAFHVTKPKRRSPHEIDFSYNDRSRTHIYCTARMIVTLPNPSKGTVLARLTRPVCAPVPADALAIESATARALARVQARRRAVDASLAALRRSLAPCARLTVPRAQRTRVRDIVSLSALEALARPVNPQVKAFAVSLSSVSTATPAFVAARAAWIDYAAALQVLPRVTNPCTAIQGWARRGYGKPAPVDFTILNRLNARMTADARVIAKAAVQLGTDGVFPQDVVAFTPAGLLLQLKIKPLISGIG